MTDQRNFINDCIEWDVVNWSKALVFWQSKINLENKNLTCLELGGRSGGLSLWLASKGNGVVCSDFTNPQRDAEVLHRKYPIKDKISYQAIDATQIPYENHFDVIVFKSILGGISRNEQTQLRHQTIDQIYKALKPGGSLLFAENLTGSFVHQFIRKKMVKWNYWNYLDLNETDQLFEKFSSFEFKTAGVLGLFGRNEFQRGFLARIDTLLLEKILGNRMKYVLFGVAKK